MIKFIVLHQHEYGVSFFFMEANQPPSEEEAARFCDNYEPQKGETLEILGIDYAPTYRL